MLYERILVGTDGSATAAKAVDRAVELSRMAGAELTIVHVGSGPKARRIADDARAAHVDSGVSIGRSGLHPRWRSRIGGL
ncbi:MAG: hypothetical protein NVS3B12_29170 [Acidimicrobiales bacterium]